MSYQLNKTLTDNYSKTKKMDCGIFHRTIELSTLSKWKSPTFKYKPPQHAPEENRWDCEFKCGCAGDQAEPISAKYETNISPKRRHIHRYRPIHQVSRHYGEY